MSPQVTASKCSPPLRKPLQHVKNPNKRDNYYREKVRKKTTIAGKCKIVTGSEPIIPARINANPSLIGMAAADDIDQHIGEADCCQKETTH